ncbi:hypothetical protein Scep_025938 [Stephania cephalantha]|uniref:Uncharacterized protein n=1 Tax=Stephania cephalantha TaxID=152367 RepID=A0AAP0HPU3_9MAGN
MAEALLAKIETPLSHRDTLMGKRKVARNGFEGDLHSDPLEQEADDDNKDDKETMTLILDKRTLNHLQKPWHRALIFTVMERTISFNYFSIKLYMNWTTEVKRERFLDKRRIYSQGPPKRISTRLSSYLENGESSVEMAEALLAEKETSLSHRYTLMGKRKVSRNGFERDLHSDPLEEEADDDNKDDKETMTLILDEHTLNHL